MELDHLKIFYDQESVRHAVRDFLHDMLDVSALHDVYKGNDVSGYKEARAIVDKSFARLEELYGEKDARLQGNKAR